MAEKSERAVAREGQEKFDFYLISLVFTLLALSVQTAKFGGFTPRDIFELAGWLAFVLSGFAGLSRLEWIPHIRTVLATQQEFEADKFDLAQKILHGQGEARIHVLESGAEQTVAQRLEIRKDGLAKLAPAIGQLERRSNRKYTLHKWAFVLAVICIVIARGIEPLIVIIKTISQGAP